MLVYAACLKEILLIWWVWICTSGWVVGFLLPSTHALRRDCHTIIRYTPVLVQCTTPGESLRSWWWKRKKCGNAKKPPPSAVIHVSQNVLQQPQKYHMYIPKWAHEACGGVGICGRVCYVSTWGHPEPWPGNGHFLLHVYLNVMFTHDLVYFDISLPR